eukprot:Blabericola_migrator_1__11599@NODE_696_length_6829_cov_299_117421_g505_i0_p1_GENE_NODE_696_length_6829_cov_299_117421_g505_i0NODE_696_length_6829_cov_299_117421_g505_i0_p1_ORF_typecomplete_len691_score100_66PhoD/PF09423_10/0_0021_NODE_696_length_6829_cov_299_117421_g505_i039306002
MYCCQPLRDESLRNIHVRPRHALGHYPLCTSNQILFPSAQNDSPAISLGPIIGHVTHNTARVMVEVDTPCRVACTLKPLHSVPDDSYLLRDSGSFDAKKGTLLTEESKLKPTITRFLQARSPYVFKFKDLVPYTRYCVTFNIPVNGLINSQFRTMPAPDVRFDACPLSVGIVGSNDTAWSSSCFVHTGGGRRLFQTVDDDKRKQTWKALYEKAARHEMSCLVHLGHNVSTLLNQAVRCPDPRMLDLDGVTKLAETDIDTALPPAMTCSAWSAAIAIAESHPSQQAKVFITQLFAQLYRNAWLEPYTRHCLANVPNVMLLNEHDIGTFTTEATHPHEELVAACAYEVFNVYCRGLIENYRPGLPPSSFIDQCHKRGGKYIDLGSIGICAPDIRAAQTFFPQALTDDQPLLGNTEWKHFMRSLKKDGKFKDTNLLIVCVQEPLGEQHTFWTHNARAVRTRTKFVNALLTWRDAQPIGYREVLVVAPSRCGSAFLTDVISTGFQSSINKHMTAVVKTLVHHTKRPPICSRNPLTALPAFPTEEEVASGKWITSPVAFFPRNRLRQLIIPPICLATNTAIVDLNRKYPSGASEVTRDHDMVLIKYSALKGTGFALVTGDADYVLKDDNMFEHVRPAQRFQFSRTHTDLVRYWTRLYFQGSEGIVGQVPIKSTEWKAVDTNLCCGTSNVHDVEGP